MSEFLSFRCPVCNARIKAPVQILGQTRACPRCTHLLLLEPHVEEAREPVLVVTDGPRGPSLALR